MTLREYRQADCEACLKLHVSSEQEAYIASNEKSLLDAAQNAAVARPFLIEAGGVPVGFAMLAVDPDNEDPEDCWWLWRLMIDAGQQGKGYGRAALREIIAWFRRAGADEITLSTKADNTRALGLYRQAGFRENGKKNGEEIILKLQLTEEKTGRRT